MVLEVGGGGLCSGMGRCPHRPGSLPSVAFSGFAGTVAASACTADLEVAGLRRYGHRSVSIAPDVILTTGGFGDRGGRHCRLTDLHALIKRGGKWTNGAVCLAQCGEAWGKLRGTCAAGMGLDVGSRRAPLLASSQRRSSLGDAVGLAPSAEA